MKKNLLTTGLMALTIGAFAQTPQTVPTTSALTQDFSLFNTSSAVNDPYPAGIQGVRVSASSPSSAGRLNATNTNISLNGSGDASTGVSGIYNYDGKIGWFSNAVNDYGFIWALNTTNIPTTKRVELKFDAVVMRNLYDGGETTPTNDYKFGVAVMWRDAASTSTAYTLIDNEFINNAEAPINTTGTTGVNPKSLTFVLPQEASNVANLQIRFVMRDYKTNVVSPAPAGSEKPSFAIDNLSAKAVEPLPVKLSSFTGKSTLNGAQLSWTTASEKDNNHFDVLRSEDGKSFSKIGEVAVAGNGNSDATLNYSYLDKNAAKGANYYKLNQVDNNGKSEEFGPVVVTVNGEPADLSVYANRASGQIKVNVYANQNGEAMLNIYDANGRTLASKNVALQAGNNEISLNSLSAGAGLHIASLKLDGVTLTKKFIFQ
nr:T9SS type A sorting domain-containing protein [uncultured Pedobacter sp.]